MIDTNKAEAWVKTVNEAENLGFRRAWKWKHNKETITVLEDKTAANKPFAVIGAGSWSNQQQRIIVL